MKRLIFTPFFILFIGIFTVRAQEVISGQVSAGLMNESLNSIMLETSSGSTTFTNNAGKFNIQFRPHDTLYFYYQGRKTVRFLTDTIPHNNFIVPIYLVKSDYTPPTGEKIKYNNFPSDTSFNNVTVVARNYHLDSLNRRKEYGDAFNYTKPKMKFGKDFTPVSLNVGKLAEVLNGSKKAKNEMLKTNLITEEQEGYITMRFNPTFVKKWIGEKVDEDTMEAYMRKKRPKFEEVRGMSDLELIDYIRRTYALYKEGK